MAAAQVPAALGGAQLQCSGPGSLQTQAVGTTPVVPPGGRRQGRAFSWSPGESVVLGALGPKVRIEVLS